MKKTIALAASAGLIVFTAACGGGGRPSVDEISEALKDDSTFGSDAVPDEAVDCIAEKFHESDISDEALQALIDGDEDYEESKSDRDAATEISDEITECVTG
ncbi:hypothetical protein [Aeromicrobium alkaliterrae]|uniref:Lipoprotein n=1 Tax=Aeromicrobium alkaliterrae TaxID=302168 RepID=A0ABN2JHU7_9ACTN